MKVNDLNVKFSKKDLNLITITGENGSVTLSTEDVKQILALHKKEMDKAERNQIIETKIKECESHGFKVKKERSWLWLIETDGRYNQKVKNDFLTLGLPVGTELLDKNMESEILESLGFEYSSTRMRFYWKGS